MSRLGWISLIGIALCLPAPVRASAQPVRIGSKSFTEQVILGEMLAQLVRHTGQSAHHRSDLGGTEIVYQALLKGDLDVYVEYTGTLTQQIFKDRKLRDDDALRRELARNGIVMTAPLGFTNNYALGMREDLAASKNIRTIGDLSQHPELRFGLSEEFMGRPDGWDRLRDRYKLSQKPKTLAHEVALNGLARGQIDVTDLYTTDAEIRAYKLRILEDERGVLATYRAVVLYRADLEERSPDAVQAIRRLEGKLDTDTMLELNARVRSDRITEIKAAGEYLEKGFGIPPPVESSSRLGKLLRSLFDTTLQHALLVGVSLAFAIVVAIPLGVLAYRRPGAGRYLLGLVGVIQTIPSMALLVFLLPFFGIGYGPALVALVFYSLLPIVRNTYNGLAEIPQALRESAEVIGLPTRARLWRIELPLASRSIVAGIKTAAVLNVGIATIGALTGAGGYGEPIIKGLRLNDVGLILSGAIPAALMAVGVQALFGWLERFLVPRGLRIS